MAIKYQSIYKSRLVSAREALSVVRSGQHILVGSGCAAPQELLRALVGRHAELSDVELIHLLTFGTAPYVERKYQGIFRHKAFFVGENVRDAVNDGNADFVPIFLSEIPELFYSQQIHLDVVLAMVSLPDKYGYCSLGIHPDILIAGIKSAKVMIAQVNREMPRVHGDTFIHISQIDYIVEHDEPLLELHSGPIDETSMAIGRHVASLIDHGSTLQMGIGNIPNAVLSLLGNHHDLGVHTEMFSDGVIDLIENGVITNTRKGLHPGKAVASFAMGTQQLYEFLDDNPFFEFHPTEYVNAPRVIAQNNRMISINSALQVDITGQVCADSIGPFFYSGIGGQVDFIRGAAMSAGGKPIIALPSTAKKGTVSRIVPQLDQGAGVVTSRGDVHYVVTEHGAAYLHGKSIRERAMALVEIAHPDFRSELRNYAVGRRYLPIEWELPSEAKRYPFDMEKRRDFKGKRLLVRPLRSVDADRLMEFFYSHDPETIFGRYRYPKKSLPREEAIRLCSIDYRKRFALAVFSEVGKDEHIVAVGRYRLNERTRFAEPYLVLHEDFRRLGIGRYLLERLQAYAKRNGIIGFTGEIDSENKAMIELHKRIGYPVRYDEETDVYHFRVKFYTPKPVARKGRARKL